MSSAYIPTPDEIAEAARRIREEGFIGLTNSHKKREKMFYPPWSAERLANGTQKAKVPKYATQTGSRGVVYKPA
jgi:hypothetical protein